MNIDPTFDIAWNLKRVADALETIATLKKAEAGYCDDPRESAEMLPPEPPQKNKSKYSIDFRDVDAKLAECRTVDEVNEYADDLLAKKLTVNQRVAIKEKIYDRRRALLIKENMKTN